MTGIFSNKFNHISGGTVTISKNTPSGTGPLTNMFVPAEFHNNFLGRYKIYRGAGSTIRALVLADGFSAASSTFEYVTTALSQTPTPSSLVLGKREMGDVSWVATLQAILDAVPLGEVPPYFGIEIETQDKADLVAAAQWCLDIQSNLFNGPNFWISLHTKDLDVLTAQAGNVIETIAKQSSGNQSSNGVTSVVWSDMTRVQKPAGVITKLQTFNLVPPFDVPLYAAWSVNKGPLQYLFFDGAPALVQGAGPFPANLEPGNNLDFDIDGFSGTAVFNGVASTILSGAAEPYAPVGGETLTLYIDGVSHLITLLNTDTTAALVATNINTVVGSAVAADDGGQVRITSPTRGTDSSIQVEEGSGANAILQFSTSLILGSGNVGNIDAVELTEAIDIIQNAAASNGIIFGNTELNIQSATYGSASYVEILNTSAANLLTEFGLVVGVTMGSGFAGNLEATTAAELAALYTLELTGVSHDSSTGRVISTTTLKGKGTSIDLLTPQVQVLTLTSSAADDIGFKYDSLPALTVVSVDEATDAAALKVLFDANPLYTSIGALEVGFDNTLRFISLDKGIHTFEDQSTGNASVSSAASGAAYSALGYTSLNGEGKGIANGHLDIALPARLLSYNNPDLEHEQRPTDLIYFNPAPTADDGIKHSGISAIQRNNIVNGDGTETYGGWCLDPYFDSKTFGTQMANKVKIQTFLSAVLFKNAVVREMTNYLSMNAQKGIFIGANEIAFNTVKGICLSLIDQFALAKHFTPYKDSSDTSFDPNRDSTLNVTPFNQQNPVNLQQGIFEGFEFNLVALSGLQQIRFAINIDGSYQANVI